MASTAALNAVKRFRLRELSAFDHACPVPSKPPPGSTPAFAPKATPSTVLPTVQKILKNPFVPHKNSETGRWIPPKYSLRQQAKLVKHAKASKALHLLPPGP